MLMGPVDKAVDGERGGSAGLEVAVRKRSDAHDPPVHDVALLHVPICPTSPPLLPDPLALGLGL